MKYGKLLNRLVINLFAANETNLVYVCTGKKNVTDLNSIVHFCRDNFIIGAGKNEAEYN